MNDHTIQTVPFQWPSLKDIDEITPINEGDYDCLAEIREVLKKHGKRERFGVTLLHKHFELNPDEVLVEYTDPKTRVLTIKPIKKEEAGNTIETNWVLCDGENQAMTACYRQCWRDVHGNHQSNHQWGS